MLTHGLHLADLYDWLDAAPDFASARVKFAATGDKSNELWSEIGEIRSTIYTRNLYTTSAHLDSQLLTNPLLTQNKPLRMFCLMVKGDIDQEIDSRKMRRDWELVRTLAGELGNTKIQSDRMNSRMGKRGFIQSVDAWKAVNRSNYIQIGSSARCHLALKIGLKRAQIK